MKTVLLCPGFKEGIDTHDYQRVIDAIKSRGYNVRFISIDWQQTTIDDWLVQLRSVFNEYDSENVILAGFSYGSMIVFLAAAERNPSELWLFSFSPYFADDLPKLKKSWKSNIGHRRVTAFGKLNFGQLAKHINCPTLIMLGAVEAEKYPMMQSRANIAKQAIKDSRYIAVAGADHDVTDPKYVQAIKDNV